MKLFLKKLNKLNFSNSFLHWLTEYIADRNHYFRAEVWCPSQLNNWSSYFQNYKNNGTLIECNDKFNSFQSDAKLTFSLKLWGSKEVTSFRSKTKKHLLNKSLARLFQIYKETFFTVFFPSFCLFCFCYIRFRCFFNIHLFFSIRVAIRSPFVFCFCFCFVIKSWLFLFLDILYSRMSRRRTICKLWICSKCNVYYNNTIYYYLVLIIKSNSLQLF